MWLINQLVLIFSAPIKYYILLFTIFATKYAVEHCKVLSFFIETMVIVYYMPRRIIRVITRRATMLAGDRSQGVLEA